MKEDLTNSNVRRQNVLNNRFALEKLEDELSFLDMGNIRLKGKRVFTKSQIATFLEVDERTIDRYISNNPNELMRNGYELIKGQLLSDFKEIAFAHDMNVVSKTTQLSIFSFKAFLNIAMLLTESEQARKIRSKILNVVVSTNLKAGDRLYINQRDEYYLPAAYREEKYSEGFELALQNYIESKPWKKKKCIDAIYKVIFKEHAAEYKKILNLKPADNEVETFYSELLTLIASFKAGLPNEFKKISENTKRQLTVEEALEVIENFGKQPLYEPQILDVCTKIATRDYTLREAVHNNLATYIQTMPEADYERFLGEKSKALEERISESLEVYKNLRDR